jgi:transcriptional regulator with PAS, ATPase and Fis domain
MGIIGTSAAIQDVLRLIRKMAPTEEKVLIEGESGTGKELVARALHLLSARAAAPFMAINSAVLQETLLESELFGYEKGAFTSAETAKPGLFEIANGGTLFIDEIGEMKSPLQAKLLRALEEGRVRRIGSLQWHQINVRIITATNRDLSEEVAVGRFRDDLYYRLNVLDIQLPPLRQRREDIPLLARHFLTQEPGGPQDCEGAAWQSLLAYRWPGNVRELRNAIQRGKILAEGPLMTMHDLPAHVVHPPSTPIVFPGPGESEDEDSCLDEVEKRHLQKALKSHAGNKSRAAHKLGISRQKLYRLMKKHA